jgi:type I restriction enzyme, S subunit
MTRIAAIRISEEDNYSNLDESPEEWIKLPLKDLIIHALGGEWGKEDTQDLPGFIRVNIIRGTDFKNLDIQNELNTPIRLVKQTSLGKRQLKNGDIIVEISGGAPDQPVGRTTLINDNILSSAKNPLICSNFCRQIRINPNHDPKFVDLSLKYQYHKGDFIKFQTQSTNIRNLNFNEFIEKTIITLPPLAEQHHIVAHVEALLSQVNAAHDRLNRVPLIMKRFRQAVLAAACSGRLTEGWREERLPDETKLTAESQEMLSPSTYMEWEQLPDSWSLVNLEQTTDSRLGKMLDKMKNKGEPTPYIRNTNVRWFDLDLSDVKIMRVSNGEREELSLRYGDILVCEGGEPGRCAIWKDKEANYIYQKALHRIRVHDNVLPEWICYCLRESSDSGRLSNLFTGSTIKHLTGVSLKKFEFLLPPIPEQYEIIRRVNALFVLADQIEHEVTEATKRTEAVTQAVLAKAFRGELVCFSGRTERNDCNCPIVYF